MSKHAVHHQDTLKAQWQHSARTQAVIADAIKKLKQVNGAIRELDRSVDLTTDPQASRAAVVRGEAPCLPLSGQKQSLVDTHNALVKFNTELDEVMELAGAGKWKKRN